MTKLVIGASGFVGSHVTRQLVDRGENVRVLIRPSSSTRALDDLDIEYHRADVFDPGALKAAMRDCDDVFYCVVDTRAWLRDPAPLFSTNVEGLRRVLDVAVNADLRRFVYTSTIGTIGIPPTDRPATEADDFNWQGLGGAYIESRVEAENLVLRYAGERGLPSVALCIANTYGPRDWQPTPHGAALAAIAAGKKVPYVRGSATESVGVEDAAAAMLLAADHGRTGERYIIAERMLSMRDLYQLAADESGVRRPFGVPFAAAYTAGRAGDLMGRMTKRDILLSSLTVRLMHIMPRMDHAKAEHELGWKPSPVQEAVRRAVAFFQQLQRSQSH